MNNLFEFKRTKNSRAPRRLGRPSEAGFTVLETAISLLLMGVVGLGAASAFFYAARNMVSASDRELAMAVAQQRVEELRNTPFVDSSLAATSSDGVTNSIVRAGRSYSVTTTIIDSNVINGNATMKTIAVRVRPDSATSVWARTVSSIFGSVTLISQRSALVVGPNRSL